MVPAARGEVVDGLAGVEDLEVSGTSREVGDVDGDQVHRDPADERAGGVAGEEREAAPPPSARRQAVGVAGGDGGDARGRGRGPGGAVADRLARRRRRGPG